MYCYQHSATCFGYYAIFRGFVVVCSILLLHYLIKDLKLIYTWVFRALPTYSMVQSPF